MNYLEVALKVRREIERESVGSRMAATTGCEISEISELCPDGSILEPCCDAYAKRMQAAMGEVCTPDYPVGMIPWLGQAHPNMYQKLIDTIPNELHQLWSQHEPLELFDWLLQQWVSTHKLGCALYRVHRNQTTPLIGRE